MKESYTEKTTGGKTYRFNTKKTAVEIREQQRPGGAAKWKTHKQCVNSQELEEAWAALDAETAEDGGQRTENGAAGTIELDGGWSMKQAVREGTGTPADGAVVATLTSPAGKGYEAVYYSEPQYCGDCQFHESLDCPEGSAKDDNRLACALICHLNNWPGDITLREAAKNEDGEQRAEDGHVGPSTSSGQASSPQWTIKKIRDLDGAEYGDTVAVLRGPDGATYNAKAARKTTGCNRCAFSAVECPRIEDSSVCISVKANSPSDMLIVFEKCPPARMYLCEGARFAVEALDTFWHKDGRRGLVQELKAWEAHAKEFAAPSEKLEEELAKATAAGGRISADLEWLAEILQEITEFTAGPCCDIGAPGQPGEPGAPEDGAAQSTGQRLKAGDTWTDPESGDVFDVVDGGGKDCDACDMPKGKCRMHEVEDTPACSGHVSADQKNLILKRRPPVALEELGGPSAGSGQAGSGQEETGAQKPEEGVGGGAGSPVEFMLVDAGRITESPFQIREIDEEDEAFKGLVESIRERGLLNPIRLRPVGGGNYELVAGHRRLRACVRAGLGQIPATVRDQGDTDAEIDLNVENLQRQDLTPLEEADSIAALLGRGLSEGEIAKRLGVSTKFVQRRKAMARVTPGWRAFCKKIGAGAEFIETAGRLPPAVADKILEAAMRDYYAKQGSASALQNLIKNLEHRVDSCAWGKRFPEWCAGCPKRSDAADATPELFEVGAETTTEVPQCLDPECWKKKTGAWVKEQKAYLKAAHGEVLTADHWMAYNFAETKSKTNCVPVLITGGPTAGNVRWAPKPKSSPEEKPFAVSDELLRKAARTEAVEAIAEKLRIGKKFGGVEFRPSLSLVIAMAIGYGASAPDREDNDSAAEVIDKKLGDKSPEELAAELWACVSENIKGWQGAENRVQYAVRDRDDSAIENSFRETLALERLLGLDEKAVDKALQPIYGKLAAKYNTKKGGAK